MKIKSIGLILVILLLTCGMVSAGKGDTSTGTNPSEKTKITLFSNNNEQNKTIAVNDSASDDNEIELSENTTIYDDEKQLTIQINTQEQLKEMEGNGKIEINTTQVKTQTVEQIITRTVYIQTIGGYDLTKYEGYKNLTIISSGNGVYLVEVPLTEMTRLANNPNIKAIVDESVLESKRIEEQKVIENEYQIRNLNKDNMEVTQDEVLDAKKEAKIQLEDLGVETDNPYSYFFLNYENVPEVSSFGNAYEVAAGILYISDSDLWGTKEKWVTVNTVFVETPTVKNNPVATPASDCEEHAMTLVLLGRRLGIEPENIRVATGYVEFDNEKFGHAWVQIKDDDGNWMDVEPTSGSYVENGDVIENEPLGVSYYKYKTYPAVEYWSFFNDVYYTDKSGSNAPKSWNISESAYSVAGSATSTWYEDIVDYIEYQMYLLFD